MRNFYGFTVLAVALVVSGCGKEQSNNPPPSTSSSSGSGYLGQLARAQQVAVKGIDTASLNQEVQLFQTQEGRLPTNLDELVSKNYLGKLPEAPAGMKLNYDATTGKVTVVPQ